MVLFPLTSGYSQNLVISPDGIAYITLFTKNNWNKIIKYNPIGKSSNTYYLFQQSQCIMSNYPSLDINGNKIAIESSCGLVILDTKSKSELSSLKYGDSYSFSPKGDSIVYSTDYRGRLEGVAPPHNYESGIWIYVFKSGATKKILNESLGSYDYINWSEHDGNIYLYKAGKVESYDVLKQRIEETSYRGIYFSPDGKYYASTPGEGVHHKLYRACDNKEMLEWNNITISNAKQYNGIINFKFWCKKIKAVVFSVANTENIILDFEKGKSIGDFSGRVIGTNSEGTVVAIHPKKTDGTDSWEKEKVEILNLEEVVSKYQAGKYYRNDQR